VCEENKCPKLHSRLDFLSLQKEKTGDVRLFQQPAHNLPWSSSLARTGKHGKQRRKLRWHILNICPGKEIGGTQLSVDMKFYFALFCLCLARLWGE
jgi:hypothetical protein